MTTTTHHHRTNGAGTDPYGSPVPPHDAEAERSVIGSIFIAPDGEVLEIASGIIGPGHFYNTDFGRIFQACLDCHEAGTALDVVTVGERLEINGDLDDVGGVDALRDIVAGVPHSAHIRHYSETVEKKYRLREFIRQSMRLANQAYAHDADPDELAQAAERLPGIAASGRVDDRFNLYSAAEFDAADFNFSWWIPGVLAKSQPCIVGAASKGLKTSICGIDLSLSLATGSPFLGRFNIAQAAGELQTGNVCVLSGESGLSTLRETARRVCRAKGWSLNQVDRWQISADLPALADAADVCRLRALVRQRRIDVLIVDPIYLALGVDSTQAANRFEMGRLLRPLGELATDTGCTPILIHHTRTASAKDYGKPPDLSDLSHAGFSEFARQWILIGRRTPYQHDGRHELIVSFGGSAGHSSLWAVDVDEGPWDAPGGRRWDVTVSTVDEARAAAREAAETERDAAARDRAERDRQAVISAMRLFPDGETAKCIREQVGFSGERIDAVLSALISEGTAESCGSILKGNGRRYPAFRLHRDASGRNGTEHGCPDAPVAGSTTGHGGAFKKPPCPGPVAPGRDDADPVRNGTKAICPDAASRCDAEEI